MPPTTNHHHVDFNRFRKRWNRLVKRQRCSVRGDRVAPVEVARREREKIRR